MLFMRFPSEVPRRMVKFCEERLNNATADAAAIANDGSMRMSRLVLENPERKRRRNSILHALAAHGLGDHHGADDDDSDDDEIGDPNSQV